MKKREKKSWPEKSQIGKSHFCMLFGAKREKAKKINNNINAQIQKKIDISILLLILLLLLLL